MSSWYQRAVVISIRYHRAILRQQNPRGRLKSNTFFSILFRPPPYPPRLHNNEFVNELNTLLSRYNKKKKSRGFFH